MTTQQASFNNNIARLKSVGFDFNGALNIIKRFNQHIEYCIESSQTYDETLFFVSQDFNFKPLMTEMILIDCMLSEPKYEKYFNNNMN